MNWTREIPTKDGLYWMSSVGRNGVSIVEIVLRQTLSWNGYVDWSHMGSEDTFRMPNNPWFMGPIPQPEPPQLISATEVV